MKWGVREVHFYKKIPFLCLLVVGVGCGIYQQKNAQNSHGRLNRDAEVGALLARPHLKISYANIHRLILQDSCIECHNPSNAKDGVSLSNYDEVKAALGRVAARALEDKDMPPNQPMGENLRSLLQLWIDQGAPEVGEAIVNVVPTASPSATPEPVASATPTTTPASTITLLPTYTSLREAVFVPKCLKCHSEGERAEEYPMDSYSALIAAVSPETGEPMIAVGNPDGSTVVTEIEAGRMPTKRSGLPKVTAEELSVIRQWILEGAKE